MSKILVIDDEKEIVELIRKGLEEAKYEVITAYDGAEGLKVLEEHEISLVILDIMMPEINGLEVCSRIRSHSNIPIIMVSAKSQEQDKISGLSEGADDYMVKPFSVAELLARVNSQIRRYTYLNTGTNTGGSGTSTDNCLHVKGLSIDEQKHQVTLFGEKVKLTPTEFAILLLLAKNKGKVFSSEEIYRNLWSDEKYYEGNNTVMAHMWRLREKIEVNPKEAKIIETVWGVGYKIED
ncbi:response regulator transcription factor [Anaeromicropila herbilytica]|uniref:Stage 0 sporulation protein A homolog n=1 Tax=Anaeromicropila herbilytica TaxID=2785025 RepID=A0A7R7EHM7_9FIRM|nr:response regulator transcription factor [Anaeromicropila herbilytica]BCN28903.1 DNA-binding response regulator [Anaeromicropila herbilytica]